MVFVIEVSFYLHQHTNISFFKSTLIDVAETMGCISQYFIEEVRGNNYVSIHVVHFSSEISHTWRACDYIKEIKKIKQVLIESVYYDEVKGQILYASREYLKNMDDCVIKDELSGNMGNMGNNTNNTKGSNKKTKYDVKKRERSYSESEILVLCALNKYKKSSKRSKIIKMPESLKPDCVVGKADTSIPVSSGVDNTEILNLKLERIEKNASMSYSQFLEVTQPIT